MYKLKAYLPGLQKYIFVKELNYKIYRNLVKSLYTGDKLKTIEQFNLILKELVDEVDVKDISLIDKLAIFLTIREVCVSPDLKLKCTCPDTNTEFNFQIPVKDIQDALEQLVTEISVSTNNLESVFSGFLLLKDETTVLEQKENDLLPALYRKLKFNNKNIDLSNCSLQDRLTIINQLPATHIVQAKKILKKTQISNSEKKLLQITSPLTGKIVYEINGNLNPYTLSSLLEYLFTEDLGNIYKAMYNVVTHCKFSAEYVDSITPAEIQVYWSYFLEENKQKTSSTNTGHIPSTANSELGF